MLPSQILKKKRLGAELSESEIRFLIEGLKTGEVSDLHITAFLTSSCIIGLSGTEVKALTLAMRDSGSKFDFTSLGKPVIDKHSTGGVGDKLSLLLVPITAEAGISVPMISGRGLGHTGGTVDKLESISGFRIRLKDSEYMELMKQNGCFMACQTEDLAPADKTLYHIRDITGNVESVGLITASILSKKLVEGLGGLVVDMKVGNGAFMQDLSQATQLASSMAMVGKEAGLPMRIIFTSMEQPLGYSVGNWLEVVETIEALSGNYQPDIRELTVKLAAHMIHLGGVKETLEDSAKLAVDIWDSGKALTKFHELVEAQGGDLEKSKNNYENTDIFVIRSEQNGFISAIDTLYIGIAGIMIGAGRKNIDDEIDYSAGILIRKKVGDQVKKGEILAELRGLSVKNNTEAQDLVKNCFLITEADIKRNAKIILDEWTI